MTEINPIEIINEIKGLYNSKNYLGTISRINKVITEIDEKERGELYYMKGLAYVKLENLFGSTNCLDKLVENMGISAGYGYAPAKKILCDIKEITSRQDDK